MGEREPYTLDVLWIVPGFPNQAAPSGYPFLEREAVQLARTGGVRLTVCSEVEGESTEHYRFIRLLPETSATGKARMVLSAVSGGAIPARALLQPRGVWYPLLWRTMALRRVLANVRPAVVHSHFSYPFGTGGVELAHSFGARSVISLRGVDLAVDAQIGYGFRLDPAYDERLGKALRSTDLCLTATLEMRRLALEAGARDERLEVLPNGIAPDWVRREALEPRSALRHRLGVPGDATLAIAVGHLVSLKGFDLGIAALTRLSSAHLLLVGDGPERDSLRALAGSLGVESRVHVIGSVAPDEVAAYYAAADVFWFLSHREAFGNVLLEATASYLPIVGVERGVAHDLLPTIDRAELIPHDPQRLADATERVLARESDPARRDGALQRFDGEVRAARLLDMYRHLIDGVKGISEPRGN